MRVSLFVSLALGMLLACAFALADEIVVEFAAGEYTIKDVENGQMISMEGFGQGGSPGAPMLPSKTYYVALPPDVVWDSLSLSVVQKSKANLPGVYEIAPGAPALVRKDGHEIADWGDQKNIVEGRDMDIYATNAFYPRTTAELRRTGQIRKWKFVGVAFQPLRYNPVTRRLLLCDGMCVSIKCERDASLSDPHLLTDYVMDGKAASKFINYHSAKKWYGLDGGRHFVPLADSFDYVIITTDAIVAGSSKLSDLVTHLTNLGHQVLIVTESQSDPDSSYGGYSAKTGQAPNETADKIRKWLQDYYSNMGLKFVLLIGDPSENGGDVPMKVCYAYDETPTDYYYADLTGNWDLDGDEYYGEYDDDTGSGGVDLNPDVYVARIPVYSADYSTLDDIIIQKVIDYDTAGGDLDWRLSALLPMSVIAYDSQYDIVYEGSWCGRAMESDYLLGNGLSTHEMYERRGTGCNSYYTPDESLVSNLVRTHWGANPYGMVWWLGHGKETQAVTGYGSGNCTYGNLLQNTDCSSYLHDDRPAFVYQGSCDNGWPDEPENLGYSLLKHGAINTVSASRVSIGYMNFDDSSRKLSGLQDIGYWYGYRLSDYKDDDHKDDAQAAVAFYEAKAELDVSYDPMYSYQNQYDFNMYGCPHTQLYGKLNNYIRLESFEAHARGRNIVLTWETGAEIDNAGFMIYRFDGTQRKAISRLIPAQGSATAGASYRFVDSNVRPGVTYVYWLVDIDTKGTWTSHGPVRARISLEPAGVQIPRTARDRLGGNAAIAG